ncbi:hypothetical protein EX895_004670 [Sporisorium graminicola]|uniref:Uncharacterized protein n=1 Tax=Sporisorium graminicola TaxID=280036 RepID=A0A4U7KQ63_9BASI|nr:hypothetical protein EX895_004670 [Sporisorium graminicola]TKY86521.1 hypothetical protein EX895_004670 [Sporisorium graminicola]
MFRTTCLAVIIRVLTLLAVTTTSTVAFEITFPGPTDYWVACGWNNMTWKSDATDPRAVTIMLTNANKTLLNDDFAIGNAVQGTENAAMVYIPCLSAASGFAVMFVNASQYDHKQNKILYTSSQFTIKPKGTPPDSASGQTNIPSQIQPYLQTPGIVLPQDKDDELTNTTAKSDRSNDALPRLDCSSSSFGTFQPDQRPNAAAGALAVTLLNDLGFISVVAAFTVLVVTS